jgi:hypothetical protein
MKGIKNYLIEFIRKTIISKTPSLVLNSTQESFMYCPNPLSKVDVSNGRNIPSKIKTTNKRTDALVYLRALHNFPPTVSSIISSSSSA